MLFVFLQEKLRICPMRLKDHQLLLVQLDLRSIMGYGLMMGGKSGFFDVREDAVLSCRILFKLCIISGLVFFPSMF